MAKDNNSSSFQRIVILNDWWLIKCSKEFEGKRFGVSGTESSASIDTKAKRGLFSSSPIIKAFDVFTLQASDGLNIILRGFLNKQLVVQNGFSPEICRYFVFGFPHGWEQLCNNYFEGISSISDKACRSGGSRVSGKQTARTNNYFEGISSKNNKACRSGGSRVSGKQTARTNNYFEGVSSINDKARRGGGSRVSGKQTARKKSLRLQSKSSGKIAEDGRKLELVKVDNTSSEGFDKAKSSDIEKNGCEAIDKGVISPAKTVADKKVTPVKEANKYTISEVSTNSLGQKRSRSGRVLVSPLEFWRNQIPVYDMNRNLIQVKEGHETNSTPSKGKRTNPQKPRR